MFGRFGWAEILVIVVLVMILFGHNKIPGMMKNLADGLNIFKKELKTDSPKAEKVKVSENKAVKKEPGARKTSVKKAAPKKTVKKK